MIFVRRCLVFLLSLVLLASLLGTALSTSANLAFAHPNKVESWLNQSNLYGHFVNDTVSEAKKAAGSSEAQGSVTLSDTAVQQAANSSFTTGLFQSSVNTFLNSNYAWLQGKTAQPTFTIDLTQAKQTFAAQIGQYVQDHINSLPVCTAQQLAEIGSASNIDPLNITCRPPSLDPKAEAALVTQKIENSSDFLSNPVITANNINPKGASTSQPYYQKFSYAPKAYRWAVKMPWVYAVVAVVSALGVIFIALRKRRGLSYVGVCLALAGIALVITKFTSDTAVNQLEKHIFNSANVGQLQQALTNFISLSEQQLAKVDLWFGIGYILLAIVIMVVLMSTRHRKPKSPKAPKAPETPALPSDDSLSGRLRNDLPPPSPVPPEPPQAPPPEEPTGPPPPPKKRPRLVQ